MINNKTFDHRPMSELMSIVRNDLRTFDDEGLIDEGTLIKTVLHCNERLGISIKELREVAIPVQEFKACLPLDFDKLYYVCALQATNTLVAQLRNPFDNSFDSDIIYEAELDRQSLGLSGVDSYQVTVKRETRTTIHQYGTWIPMTLNSNCSKHCHIDCPNLRKPGRYEIEIKDGEIHTPFRAGTLYMMYIGMMKDADGNITFPFHPLITPYYEWALKEKVLLDAMFNSDAANISDLLKLTQQERAKAWLDAYNFTMDRDYTEYVAHQKKKELSWYHQYFRYLQ